MLVIKAAGNSLNVTLDPTAGQQQIKKRVHDLQASMRSLELCVGELNSGYKFDDDMADAKIASLSKAAKILSEELSQLSALYKQLSGNK